MIDRATLGTGSVQVDNALRARADLAALQWDRQINAIVEQRSGYDLVTTPRGLRKISPAEHSLLDRRRGMTPLLVQPFEGLWPERAPLVSIIVVSVDYGAFLPDAIESIRAQTFADLEVIVVDGGSRDLGSRLAAATLAGANVRVLFQSETRGPGANRNFGICQARGKYVCCLDADDLLAPSYIERCVELLESGVCDVASSAIEAFGEVAELRTPPPTPDLAHFLSDNGAPVCAVFSRRAWLDIGGYRDAAPSAAGRIHEDWLFWAMLAARGARFHNIAEPLIRYRVHTRSLTSRLPTLPVQMQRELVRECCAGVAADRASGVSTRPPMGDSTDFRSLSEWAGSLPVPNESGRGDAMRRLQSRLRTALRSFVLFLRKPAPRRHACLVRQSGLFDAEWYRGHNPDVAASGLDPLQHYVTFGASEGRAPGPGFDPDWYVRTYPEAFVAGGDPLIHFIKHGVKAGYLPTRQSGRLSERVRDLVAQSGLFDPQWYKRQFPASRDGDPLEHYVNSGGVAGFPAGPRFDSGRYAAQNPDVAECGQNPLLHYLRNGMGEGRPCPRVVNDQVREALTDGLSDLEAIEPDLAPRNYVEAGGWPRVLHFGEASPLMRRWTELVGRIPDSAEDLTFVEQSGEIPAGFASGVVVSASDLARSAKLSASALVDPNAAPSDISRDEQALLATALAQSLRPRRLVVAGGDAAWRAVALYSQALARSGAMHLVCRASDLERSERRNALREAFAWAETVWAPDVETAELIAHAFHLPLTAVARLRVLDDARRNG